MPCKRIGFSLRGESSRSLSTRLATIERGRCCMLERCCRPVVEPTSPPVFIPRLAFFCPPRQSHHFVAIFLCSFSSFSFLSIVRNSISNEEKIISSHVLLISLNLDLEIVDENFVPAAVERSPFRRGANLFGFDINRTRGEKMDRYLGPLGGPGVNLSPLAAHK